jgi:inorganic phosphate transporter, PiT family
VGPAEENASTMLWCMVIGAVIYGFLNGYKDAAGITATVVSSRALGTRATLALVAAAEFCGPFLFGASVASTLGRDLIERSAVRPAVILAALGSAITWNVVMALLGFPSSSTHALIGGMIGAAVAHSGPASIFLPGLARLLAVLFVTPLIGLILGYGVLKLIIFIATGASPDVNMVFKRLQLVTATALALTHGSNDAQKSLGIIILALIAAGRQTEFKVPLWALVVSATALALGALAGSGRVIRTVGAGIFRVRPVHAFAAQIASATIVFGAGLAGAPVSTPQVLSGAVMGAGAGDRVSRVRWGTAGQIGLAWLVTLPASALLAAALWAAVLSRLALE